MERNRQSVYLNWEFESLLDLKDACQTGNLTKAEELLDAGTNANGNKIPKNGDTRNLGFIIIPLLLASEFGHLPVVKLLLERGADVNQDSHHEVTALHVAARNGHADIVTLLLAHNANVHAVNFERETALHRAATGRHISVIDALLSAGADVNAVASGGETPLHCASREGHVEAVNYLLQRNANVHAVSSYKETPLHRAMNCHKNRSSVIKLLLAAGADVNAGENQKPLHIAALSGDLISTEFLLANGADPKAVDSDDDTPLHFASRSVAVVKALISAGANVNALNRKKQTPLHLYARKIIETQRFYERGRSAFILNIDAIRALLEHGADYSLPDIQGRKPFDHVPRSDLMKIEQLTDIDSLVNQQQLLRLRSFVFHNNWKDIEEEKEVLLASVTDSRPPEEHFDKIEILGKGSFGTVWRATHKQTKKEVAIKITSKDESKLEDEFLFLCKATRNIELRKSSAYTEFFSRFFHQSDVWIVMELCHIGSLADMMMIRNRFFLMEEIACIANRCVQALADLHSEGKLG
eukprot:TRINITY_DN11707_c0_g1_i1.p1 TRINITY_DN11707_c0_g1~~TRINITY_DN11707_c0_g1_i1.p1  ORF type:complete len:526 (+),score=54.31 TRINITY_DN11707_c0_g1_i1:62-1639(+)